MNQIDRVKRELSRMGGAYHLRDWDLALRVLAAVALYWLWLLAGIEFLPPTVVGYVGILSGLGVAGLVAHLIVLGKSFLPSSLSSTIFVTTAAVYLLISGMGIVSIVLGAGGAVAVLFCSYRAAFAFFGSRRPPGGGNADSNL